jgi:hypothetical protein
MTTTRPLGSAGVPRPAWRRAGMAVAAGDLATCLLPHDLSAEPIP